MRVLSNARPFTHVVKKPASSYVPFTVHFGTPALSPITAIGRPRPETVRAHRHPYATAFLGLVRVFICCDGRHAVGEIFEFDGSVFWNHDAKAHARRSFGPNRHDVGYDH